MSITVSPGTLGILPVGAADEAEQQDVLADRDFTSPRGKRSAPLTRIGEDDSIRRAKTTTGREK
jgi:hypothetical protein